MKDLIPKIQILLVSGITCLYNSGCEGFALLSPDHHPASVKTALLADSHKVSSPSTKSLSNGEQVKENPEEELMGNATIENVKRINEDKLFAIDGVEGVGIGDDENGKAFIQVYVRDKKVVSNVPKSLEGFPVKTLVSGEFDAY